MPRFMLIVRYRTPAGRHGTGSHCVRTLDPGVHCDRASERALDLGFDPGFIAFQLARPSRTLPYRYIDLTVKTGHTVLTKSIYLNTESHNLS